MPGQRVFSLCQLSTAEKGSWPFLNVFFFFFKFSDQVEHAMRAVKYNFKIVSCWFLFVKQTTKCAFERNNLRYTNEKPPCNYKVLLLNMA